jgi:hypothetical protein
MPRFVGSVSRYLRFALVAIACWFAPQARAADAPAHLPRYDLDISFETDPHRAVVRERVTWTNRTKNPVAQLAFNFYPHFKVPAGDALLFAKTVELLRLQPSLGIDREGLMGDVKAARLVVPKGEPVTLSWSYEEKNPTSLRFDLPAPVKPGDTVVAELVVEVRLPNKQGRWGRFDGVTYLTNAVPLLAVCDDTGWKPMPFVPWHQPWYNEAGVFNATVTVPANELVACSAVAKREAKTEDGRKRIEYEPFVGRDFAVLASARYREFTSSCKLPDGRTVALKCLAFPEHEFYATEILKIVGDAIPVYSKWFGAYPYSQFTVAESYFGWNGNECSGLVMVDERIFGAPHLARNYVEYLVSHETCHQWWYNLVGTNGYSEPFMDEGAAAYFTHKLIDQKRGKNNEFLEWPSALKWLPNIKRENYRYGTMFHSIRNNEMTPAAQDLPEYKHLIGLFTGAYDRGSKVFGMIEDRLGEAEFMAFVQGIVKKYSWRILSAKELRAELEAHTGRDWGEFFERWVFGTGLTDWQVERVRVEAKVGPRTKGGYTATAIVKQDREFTEPTVVSFSRGNEIVRVPVGPMSETVRIEQIGATVMPLGDNRFRVEAELPFEPEQVTIDPDGVLLDANPGNNRWKPGANVRITPLYTMLDETGLTTDFDRWNVVAGPWVWGPAAQDPWYTRSTMAGLRVGAFRTEKAAVGLYTAIRSEFRDAVIGADARILTLPQKEIGFNYERRIGGPYFDQDGAGGAQRASAYFRNIRKETSSLYLPPVLYDEAFVSYQDNFLPFARARGGDRPERTWMAGWHLRLNLNTPYWDPECGVWFDATAAGGHARFSDGWKGMAQFRSELALVHTFEELPGPLSGSRLAVRGVGMVATPERGQFFALGGGTLFRGFDLAERQGSALWVANIEMRVPLARTVQWDVLDHVIGGRNLWAAAFYDVGAVYANRRAVGGGAAHAIGVGLRLDTAIFSFIERATLRFDVAKPLTGGAPMQFWFGVQHAF